MPVIHRPIQTKEAAENSTSALDNITSNEEYVISPPTNEDDIANQIGYSPMSGSNIFADLQQLLKDETVGSSELSSLFQGPSVSQHLEGRYWALVAELPSEDIVKELIGIFLSEVNWYYNMIERHYIFKQFQEWLAACNSITNLPRKTNLKGLSRDLQYFPALLFQLLAISLQFAPQDSVALLALHLDGLDMRERLSAQYSGKGMELMTVLGRHNPTLTAVQQDLLRASWLKNCGRGNESWQALGNAIRQAQELNLHLQSKVNPSGTADMSETLERLWYDEYKRRVWIMLFIWDSHMALVLGRPRIINASDCDIKLPIDCNIPENPKTTIPTAVHSVGDGEKPSLLTPVLLMYSFSQFIHQMRGSGADKRCPKDYSVVSGLDHKVLELMDDLPPVMRPHNPDTSWDSRSPSLPRVREQILTAANQLLLALHRTHIHVHQESRGRAIKAAFAILEAQQRFFDKTPPNQYRFFGLAFSTIDAASFLAAIMMMQPPPDQELELKIQNIINQVAIKLQLLLEYRNALAASGLKLIRHCQSRFQNHAGLARGSYPSVETPQISNQALDGSSEAVINFVPHGNDDHFLESFNPNHAIQSHDDSSSGLDFGRDFSDVNTFDASFWIDQMNQIPILGDDPAVDPVWDAFFE
ncbi:fungal specific transcription factor domain-containing protein [Phlyctema vagabunda]|uniref:Fungal specific transcription factor domain-containing protein n=1 Tax=Phlyctema vagabunda TaxID=108571 RepID=A0ABR4PY98_9HELO